MKVESKTTKDKSGFMSIKKIPSNKDLGEFYNKYYFQDKKLRPKEYQDEYDKIELRHKKLLNELFIHSFYTVRPEWKQKKIKMLEIGVGEGFLAAYLLEQGWDVKGIDFSSFGIKKFNPKIIDRVKIGNAFEILENMKHDGKKFDMCMIRNVLEHVRDPRKLLMTSKKILAKDGILAITVPNDFSKLQLRAYNLHHIKSKFWIKSPEHLHYFNTENIFPFMKEMGLKILDIYSNFPIDFFLFHPGSNYVERDESGKGAHRARIEIDLLMAQKGIKKYHELCQSWSKCGVGRDLTLVLEKI